jgi:hypothetical protein
MPQKGSSFGIPFADFLLRTDFKKNDEGVKGIWRQEAPNSNTFAGEDSKGSTND